MGASRRTKQAAGPVTRERLMDEHRAARERREQAPLGSDAYRAAAEEIARIEVAIAELEEPPPATLPAG
jgi:hypothetical protein